MTDRIVQFTDGEDNNIFPVAGALKSGSVTTSTINDEAVTTAKIADGAVTSGKISLATSTQTLTFKNAGGSTMGTGTATMIPLDNNGLVMLCFRGGTGGLTTQPGAYEVKIYFENAFSQILTVVANGWSTGDSGSYLAFNTFPPSGTGDCYIVRTRSDGETLELSLGLMMIGYLA